MAINISEFKLPITPEATRSILQRHTDIFGVFIDLDRVLEYEANYSYELFKKYPRFRELAGVPNLVVTKRNDILDVVKNRFGVPSYKLLDKDKKEAVSKDVRKRLIIDPDISEDAREFIKLYHDMSKLAYYMSYLGQYKNLPISTELDKYGHRMVIARPSWNLLATSRISAEDPSIQNIARELPDLITEPRGYTLWRADSGQIEPRITYSNYVKDELIKNLIIAYDDAYYGMLFYIWATKQEEVLLRQDFNRNFKKQEITDELKAKRQDLKVLGLAGNYGSQNLDRVDKSLAAGYTEKIVNHPLRMEWEKIVRDEVDHGVDTFYGAFGTPVTPEETTKYEKDGPGWKGHLIRCGINNPIQTTASELMIFSVNEADKLIAKTKDSHIGYYKHDEGAFYVADQDSWVVNELAEVTAYNVKGWIPIGSDILEGKKINKEVPTILD